MLDWLLNLLSRPEVWVSALGLAAFLALFWALRGAPVGQSAETDADTDDAPAAGYRDRVIAAVVLGLLLVAGGGVLALTRGVLWSLPPFAAGFGIVLALIAFNQRYRHASPALRRAVDFSNLALTTALVLGILIVINVLAFRYGGRPLDLTRERSFSLSTLTRAQLATLDRPVTFTVLFGEGPLAAPQRTRVLELLDLYRAANPKSIKIDAINPFRELERVETLTKRIPNLPLPQDGGIVIELGDGGGAHAHALLRNNDLFAVSRSGRVGAFESTFKGEDAVTSALIALREERKPKVIFTTGHGEPSIENHDLQRPGVGLFRTRLGAIGVDVSEVSLLTDDIPADAALVVIVAPQEPFKPDELARLEAYTGRGGPLLVLAGNLKPTGLDAVLRAANVEVGKGLLVDPKHQLRGRASLVFVPATRSIKQPIVDPLVDRYVLMPNAAPLHLLGVGGSKPPNPAVQTIALLRTPPESWAETEKQVRRDPDKDESGPLIVGVAASALPKPGATEPGTPKLVLFSSGALADNAILEMEPTNLDLLMNAIAWLRGKEALRGIAPKKHVALMLTADPVLRARLVLVPTVIAVLLIIGLGVTTYAARRD